MPDIFFEDKEFKSIDFTENPLEKGDYEHCSFISCDFSKVDLSHFSFVDCTFEKCRFNLAKLYQTTIREVIFTECNLIGLHFERANTSMFSAQFISSQLDVSSFVKMPLRLCKFEKCKLKEVDFSSADLRSVSFEECDLTGTVFNNTNLEKADFRTAFNFIIQPDKNRLSKARFSKYGLEGLLRGFDIRVD